MQCCQRSFASRSFCVAALVALHFQTPFFVYELTNQEKGKYNSSYLYISYTIVGFFCPSACIDGCLQQ